MRAATTPPAKQFQPGQTNSFFGYGYQTNGSATADWALLLKRGFDRSLFPILDRQDATSHRLDQILMVGFGLVRVGTGEAAQAPV